MNTVTCCRPLDETPAFHEHALGLPRGPRGAVGLLLHDPEGNRIEVWAPREALTRA